MQLMVTNPEGCAKHICAKMPVVLTPYAIWAVPIQDKTLCIPYVGTQLHGEKPRMLRTPGKSVPLRLLMHVVEDRMLLYCWQSFDGGAVHEEEQLV